MSNISSRWREIEKKREAGKKFLREPTKENFINLAEKLWATQARSSIEYYADDMVFSEKTPKEIAETITEVLEGDKPIKNMLDLTGMGWQTTTEILHTLRPVKYSILGKRSVSGIKKLYTDYRPPSPQTASINQYDEFTEKTKKAVEKYKLRQHLKDKIKEWNSEDIDAATDLEIADAAFSLDYEGHIDLTQIKKQAEKKEILDFFPKGIQNEIQKIIEQKGLYTDEKDFIVSAVRKQIKKEQKNQ